MIARLLLLFFYFSVYSTQAKELDDFAIVKSRVVDELLKTDIDDARVAEIVQAMNEDEILAHI